MLTKHADGFLPEKFCSKRKMACVSLSHPIASSPSHGKHRLSTTTLDMNTLRRGLFSNTVGAIGGGGRFSLLSRARARETSFSLTRSSSCVTRLHSQASYTASHVQEPDLHMPPATLDKGKRRDLDDLPDEAEQQGAPRRSRTQAKKAASKFEVSGY